MNTIQYYPLSCSTGTTQSTQISIDKWDQLLLFVPTLSTVAGSGVITADLKISYGVATAVSSYYYDYVNAAPAQCRITMSTGGCYELPNGGSGNGVQIKFDVAMTQATTFYLLSPKTTY